MDKVLNTDSNWASMFTLIAYKETQSLNRQLGQGLVPLVVCRYRQSDSTVRDSVRGFDSCVL